MKTDPYYQTNKSGGLDIVYRNFVIQRRFIEDTTDEGIRLDVGDQNAVYSRLRGTLELISGFESKKEKTGIFPCDNFAECIDRLNDILRGNAEAPGLGEAKDWFTQGIAWYAKKPEEKVQEGMVEYYRKLADRPFGSTKRPVPGSFFDVWPKIRSVGVQREHHFGRSDIMINELSSRRNRVPVEIKPDEANAYDVFQLFKDIEGWGARRGILVARGLSEDGWAAIRHLGSLRKMGLKRVRIHFHDYTNDGCGSLNGHSVDGHET